MIKYLTVSDNIMRLDYMSTKFKFSVWTFHQKNTRPVPPSTVIKLS